MDSGVAAAFRSVRVQHGVSIADAARSLGVDASYLEAIEDGSIEHTASEVVAKAHVRVYARYLGYDSEAVLRGSPPGTPAADAPITHQGDPDGSLVFEPRRRIAPAARVTGPRHPRPDAPGSDDGAAAEDGDGEDSAPASPSGVVEVVDEPPDLDADLDDDLAGRRRLAALAIVGSILVGLLVAFAVSAANAADAFGAPLAASAVATSVARR